jgi:hypothetical protein
LVILERPPGKNKSCGRKPHKLYGHILASDIKWPLLLYLGPGLIGFILFLQNQSCFLSSFLSVSWFRYPKNARLQTHGSLHFYKKTAHVHVRSTLFKPKSAWRRHLVSRSLPDHLRISRSVCLSAGRLGVCLSVLPGSLSGLLGAGFGRSVGRSVLLVGGPVCSVVSRSMSECRFVSLSVSLSVGLSAPLTAGGFRRAGVWGGSSGADSEGTAWDPEDIPLADPRRQLFSLSNT